MLRCLRPDVPTTGSFSVTELPHRAKLDQNEAPVDVPAPLKAELARALANAAWNRYPQPRAYREVKATFAAALGLPPETIALTAGCDQVIQAAFLLAGGGGRRARWFEPTYPHYALCARATGTEDVSLALGVDVDARIDAAAVTMAPEPHLVVLVAPNNPTGGMPGRGALEAALADEGRLVLVDEAYADFAGETVLPLVARHPNLLVGRSLSKALLAAVRLGFAIGHPEVIAAIERIYTAPYHLNELQLLVAARYAELLPHVRAAVAQVVAERERVRRALAGVAGVAPRESRGNFLLFRVPGDAAAIARGLAEDGVRLRDVSGMAGLAGHLRVTIGTAEENDLFVRALAGRLAAATGG